MDNQSILDLKNDGFALKNDSLGNGSRLDNSGTLRKSVGNGVTTVRLDVDNSGRIDVQTGKLDILGTLTANGGRLQGSIEADAYFGDDEKTTIAGDLVADDVQIRDGETVIELGGTLEANVGQVYVGAASETRTGRLTNFGAIKSDVAVEAATLFRAGEIQGDLTLRNATLRNASEGGTPPPFDVAFLSVV